MQQYSREFMYSLYLKNEECEIIMGTLLDCNLDRMDRRKTLFTESWQLFDSLYFTDVR